jgi:hypothetical protein
MLSLAVSADLVLVDLDLEGDMTGETAPGWVLADAYQDQGYAVLGLAPPGLLAEAAGVRVLHKPVDALVGPPGTDPDVVSIDRAATYTPRPPT